MIPVPGAPVVVTLNCECGVPVQRVRGHEGDGLCYWCSPATLARREELRRKADAEAARPKHDVLERQ